MHGIGVFTSNSTCYVMGVWRVFDCDCHLGDARILSPRAETAWRIRGVDGCTPLYNGLYLILNGEEKGARTFLISRRISAEGSDW